MEEERVSSTWITSINIQNSPTLQDLPISKQPVSKSENRFEYLDCSYRCYVNSIIRKISCQENQEPDTPMAGNEFENVKEIIKNRANKHSAFYKNLLNENDKKQSDIKVEIQNKIFQNETEKSKKENKTSVLSELNVSKSDININKTGNAVHFSSEGLQQMSQACTEIHHEVQITQQTQLHTNSSSELLNKEVQNISGPIGSLRQRKTGVFQMYDSKEEEIKFPSVQQYITKYTELIQNQMDNKKQKWEEKENKKEEDNFLVPPPPPSGYCSSSNNSDDECRNFYKTSDVKRCCSSDSALGLLQSDEERSVSPNTWSKKEENNDLPEFNPYFRRSSIDHFNVPTKTLIEANIVPFPLNRKLSEDSIEDLDGKFDSRRQSCFTDDGDDPPRYRYWRTPSVVVSDYSDDVIGGLTLEDIEYFRNQRKSVTSSPDSSLNSSCSNLNYCGSSVSILEGDYTLRTPSRKSSDCSTISTFSNNEDEDYEHRPHTLTNIVYGNKVSPFFCLIW